MISANSENEQATTITLTETELEGIYGGWRGYGRREMGFRGDYERDSYRGYNERYSYRGDYESYSYRGYNERNSYRGDCW